MYLIQAATSPLMNHAAEIGIAALVGMNAWQLRVTLQFRDESRSLRQWAFGEEGNNGANSRLKVLYDRTDKNSQEIIIVHGKLELHESRIEEMDRRVGPSDRRHS